MRGEERSAGVATMNGSARENRGTQQQHRTVDARSAADESLQEQKENPWLEKAHGAGQREGKRQGR